MENRTLVISDDHLADGILRSLGKGMVQAAAVVVFDFLHWDSADARHEAEAQHGGSGLIPRPEQQRRVGLQ